MFSLGTVILDLFSIDDKPGLKYTVAYHGAEKDFTSDYLVNLDADLKADSRFEEFHKDISSPITCYLITDLKKKYCKNEIKTTKSGAENESEDKSSSSESEESQDSSESARSSMLEDQIRQDGGLMLTIFDILHICHELGYVLQHLIGQASSQIFRTCCSEREIVQILPAMLQHLILRPKIIQRISSTDFTGSNMTLKHANRQVEWCKWEEPFKVLSLVQNGYLDHFSHINLHEEPEYIRKKFSTIYLLLKDDQTLICPNLLLSLTEQNAGRHYSQAWAYHVSKLIYEATFKVRNCDRQVGRDFRRYFLEPDVNVDFRVRLRNFLGENPNYESSFEKNNKWF